MNDTLKKTPLYDVHLGLGAKMVPFAGYEMPVQYPTGITAEHHAVREAAGLFDVSHMGEFLVHGPQALQSGSARERQRRGEPGGGSVPILRHVRRGWRYSRRSRRLSHG